MKLLQSHMQTLIGPLYLVASDHGLQGIHWAQKEIPLATKQDTSEAARILSKTVQQLEEYFAGQRKQFDLPLNVSGTPFQQQVWRQLSKIPYGETCSYKAVAEAIHNKKAVRAVGTANGRNPLAIIVPCHRVIAANGGIGGYAGGLAIKTTLLQLEKTAGARHA